MRALALIVATTLAGCAGEGTGFWSRLETNVEIGRSGGPLSLDWEVGEPAPDGRRITGYVYNRTDYRIGRVYLRIESLDAREQVIATRYWWVMGDVPATDRAYFDVPALPVADHYRVSVYSYYIDAGPASI